MILPEQYSKPRRGLGGPSVTPATGFLPGARSDAGSSRRGV